MSPNPELLEAYRLIKTGQKPQAGRILKTYLAHTKNDPQAWWLMAHVVDDPATARRCLNTVLKIDPDHAQARARLAKLSPTDAPAPEPTPTTALMVRPDRSSRPAPSRPRPPAAIQPAAVDDDFPSDAMVLASVIERPRAHAAPLSVPAARSDPFAPDAQAADPFAPASDPFAPDAQAAAPFAPASDQAASFEAFLATDQTVDPFAGPPVDDPFAPSAHTGAPASYDPFAPENVFNPSAGAGLAHQASAQAAGTGNQPGWGPGLAFVPDSAQEIGGSAGRVILTDDDLRVERRRKRGSNPFLIIGGLVGVFILVGLVYAAISLIGPREKVPRMTTMDIPAFSIDYPKGWDQRCAVERSGYPVCGMANHHLYNEVDYFAGTDIDLGKMFGELFGFGFTGQNLPDEAVSIIAMDVPRTSPAYDDASWAKTLYRWDFGDKPTYNKKTMQVDGYEAYYYEFKSHNQYFTWAAWDVYILHDNVVFWLRIDYSGDGKKAIPQKMVNKMIESIDIK